MGIFTISREDIYDYFRCPKIVSIKAHRLLAPPEEKPNKIRVEPEVSASTIGKIGEAAVAAAFSPAAAIVQGLGKLQEVITRQTEMTVSRLGVTLDNRIGEVVKETVNGITQVRQAITEEYGEVQVIGRGGCKNGPFPGEALPDFIAISPKLKQPVLIEAKNTIKASNSDRFQARFYNTVARETGVVVHEQRFEGSQIRLDPIAYHESIAETLLVYPRGSSYEKILDRIDMGKETIKDIWLAKQLGYCGKSPHTNCDSRCPHHRLGIELPEGNMEVVTPMPLVYAKGLAESSFDMDTEYLHNYFMNSGLATGTFELWLRARNNTPLKKQFVEEVASKTCLPFDIVQRMVFPEMHTQKSEKIAARMASAFEPWENIFGKERADKYFKNSARGQATRLYTLPNDSLDFINRSWKKWAK